MQYMHTIVPIDVMLRMVKRGFLTAHRGLQAAASTQGVLRYTYPGNRWHHARR